MPPRQDASLALAHAQLALGAAGTGGIPALAGFDGHVPSAVMHQEDGSTTRSLEFNDLSDNEVQTLIEVIDRSQAIPLRCEHALNHVFRRFDNAQDVLAVVANLVFKGRRMTWAVYDGDAAALQGVCKFPKDSATREYTQFTIVIERRGQGAHPFTFLFMRHTHETTTGYKPK